MDDITKNNINEVNYRILLKMNSNYPYYATKTSVKSIVTDIDHFPYERFFRGQYDSEIPIVMDREAGYRPIRNSMYTRVRTIVDSQPKYCWQYPCTSVKPCQQSEDDKSEEVGGDKKKCIKNYVISP